MASASVSVAEEEARRARASLSKIPAIDFMDAERLFQHGFRSIREIAESSSEELFDIEGLSQEQAAEILKNAKAYVDEHGDELEEGEEAEGHLSDLDRLGIAADLRETLMSGGFKTIQSLVEADDDALRQVSGIDDGEVDQIRGAVESFLRSGSIRAADPFSA